MVKMYDMEAERIKFAKQFSLISIQYMHYHVINEMWLIEFFLKIQLFIGFNDDIAKIMTNPSSKTYNLFVLQTLSNDYMPNWLVN